MSLPTRAFASLTRLADQINEAFRAVDSSRVRAGLLLIEARKHFEAGGKCSETPTWSDWCARHIDRSMADIRKCMVLARAANPAAAAEAERAKARVGMAATREKRANVSALSREERKRIYHDVLTRPDQPRLPIPGAFAGHNGEFIMAVRLDGGAGEMTIRAVWKPDTDFWLRNADKMISLVATPVREDRPVVVAAIPHHPQPETVARPSGHLVCVLGPYRCEHQKLCRKNHSCWEAKASSMAEAPA